MSAARRIGLIGYGAIARTLLQSSGDAPWIVVGILRRTTSAAAPDALPMCQSFDELLALNPELIVECAGHEALRTFGPRVLAAGIDLLVASTGALADQAIEESLRSAAAKRGSRALLIAGAVGGLDALGAAR